MQTEKILLIGAFGQIGTELTEALQGIYGDAHVIASDIRLTSPALAEKVQFEQLNVLDSKRLGEIIDKHHITQIYHLAAVLSASGEQDPMFAWQLNMDGTINVLEAAREKQVSKVYFPSSIAVFGKDTPRINTPQHTVMNPSTIYGISKLAGEPAMLERYVAKHRIDAECLCMRRRDVLFTVQKKKKSTPSDLCLFFRFFSFHIFFATDTRSCPRRWSTMRATQQTWLRC